MVPLAALGIGSGLAQGLSGIASLFKNKTDPSKEANKYLNQIPGTANPYYQPYIDAGKSAQESLTPQYNQMFSDPSGFFSNLGSGYKESPGYQFNLNQALQAGSNASAAGGMLGSLQHQQEAMETASGIASKDYENYINHILSVLGIGQSGLEGQSKQGFDASTNYADLLSSVLNQQAQNAYSGAANKNTANSADWSNIFSGAGGALAGYLSKDYQPTNYSGRTYDQYGNPIGGV